MAVNRRALALAGVCAVACSSLHPARAAARQPDPDPARFAAEIRAFDDQDRTAMPPAGAVVFVGSSSIRLWPIAERFPGLPVLNRGFGGSHISDVNHHVDVTVLRYRPKVVVFYAGDNDLAAGKTPDRVLGDYRTFVGRVREALPGTAIVFVAVKPSLARWATWPAARLLNERIRAFSKSAPGLYYADIVPPMLDADGRPRPELFVGDGLHLSPAGYDIWTDVVRRSLAPLVGRP
jgi:lysophospholipase L1-like esterase